jgi:hypothetical protein
MLSRLNIRLVPLGRAESKSGVSVTPKRLARGTGFFGPRVEFFIARSSLVAMAA